MRFDVAWGEVGTSWKLHSFKECHPPTWDGYLNEQRAYWGTRITGRGSENFSWTGSEEKWLEYTRRGYENYVVHCSKWHGKFSKGELIPVLRTEGKNTIKLCIVKNEMTTWHNTIELWLCKEVSFFPPDSELKWELYTFSTLVDHHGRPTNYWKQGTPSVAFSKNGSKVSIGDASFEIIRT